MYKLLSTYMFLETTVHYYKQFLLNLIFIIKTK